MKKIIKEKIKKILVISLSNIGDVVLTLPVLDILKRDFPNAELSLVVGPKSESLFLSNPHLKHVYIFDKKQNFIKSFLWICSLKKEGFDFVLDLRNTAIPVLLFPKYRASVVKGLKHQGHMREKHLLRLKSVYEYEHEAKHQMLSISQNDLKALNDLLEKNIFRKKYVVVAPGSASSDKQWKVSGFAEVCDYIIKDHDCDVIFVGNSREKSVGVSMEHLMKEKPINLCGQLSLIQSAELIKGALMVIVNDSAPMHLASYLNVPTVAIFGPSDPIKYGPWGENSAYLYKNAHCHPCQYDNSDQGHTCMWAISTQDILNTFQIIDNQVKINPSKS